MKDTLNIGQRSTRIKYSVHHMHSVYGLQPYRLIAWE